ncbi:hypothetical protein [Janthinobacterium sp. HH01]|nr:hypothetical protein [Janthinobacterium sp. HH01]
MTRNCAEFLRRALRKHGGGWEDLALATVELRFNAPHALPAASPSLAA